MSYYRYGKEEKKITFADTDQRHAELRLKLRRDGISQVDFFKSMVTGYIDNDPNILMYMTSVQSSKVATRKSVSIAMDKSPQRNSSTLAKSIEPIAA